MNNLKRNFIVIISLFITLFPIAKAEDPSNSQKTKWFRDARVGIIVHWGLYSIPAGVWDGKKIGWYGEWIENRANVSDSAYSLLAAQFNPTNFNARQWIGYVKQSGFKYFCIVTKHHDGFSLWDTKQNKDWNIMNATPFKRDIVKELATACHDSSITYALYYSTGLDWHYPSTKWSYKPYFYNQLKELLTNYGKIGYLWFDGEWTKQWSDAEAEELSKYVTSIDPDIMTNNPKHKGSADYGNFGIDEEYFTPKGDDWYKTKLWERDRLIQDSTWGYKSWEKFRTPKLLIQDMIDAASKSMNYCLNIGPKADGSFPAEAIHILNEFGKWLKVNGEAIYETNGFVNNLTINCNSRVTYKGNNYYVHVTDWNAPTMTITTPLEVKKVTSLNSKINIGKPTIKRSNGNTIITINKPTNLDPYATVLKLESR